MRASSSWIKLQFVVRKHVMNTYQMHTLSLFLYSITFSLPLFLSAPSLIFLSFDSSLSFWLIPSLCFWWSVILMRHIQICCIMYPFVCTSVCICVCSHFLYICKAYLEVVHICHSVAYYDMCLCLGPLECAVANCALVSLLSLSPYHRPPWGCPHLEAVVERAWCVGMEWGGPG